MKMMELITSLSRNRSTSQVVPTPTKFPEPSYKTSYNQTDLLIYVKRRRYEK